MGFRKAILIVFVLVLPLFTGVQLVDLTIGNFFPDPGPDLPLIYIRNDGNIDPEIPLIERTGNIYKLEGNLVNFSLVIQCDNIVFDGQENSIQGNATRIKGYDEGNNGIIVNDQKNITIKNIFFEKGETGIRLSNSSDLTIANNSFRNGIRTGISLQDSTQILIHNNRFTDLLTDLNAPAMMLNGSKIIFTNNTVTGSSYGIMIKGSSNIISENTIECILPIQMDNAKSNIISFNKISGPAYWADRDSFIGNEGIALFSRCSDNIICGNNITGFVNNAIRTVFSCSNNTFYGNYVANTGVAISFQDGAINNTFYGNCIAFDSCKVRIDDNVFGTSWDNGTLGNYWDDYSGTDNNEDGIGDSPYAITGVKWDTNVGGDVSFVTGYDNYPLINPLDIETIPEFTLWTPFLISGLIVIFLISIIYRHNFIQIEEKMKSRKSLFAVLLILCLILPIITVFATEEDSWTTLESMPTARSGLGIAIVNNKIYAIGGTITSGFAPSIPGSAVLGNNDIGGHVGTNEEYDPATGKWTRKASMPTPRIVFAIAVYQNKIYCIGGKTAQGFTAVNEVYDPEMDTWETKTSMTIAKGWLTANVVDNKIYVISGTSNEVYDPTTDTWIIKTPPPEVASIASFVSAVYENKIYVFGGLSEDLHYNLNQIYDTETDTWNTGTPPITSVGGGAAVITSGVYATKRIYVLGNPSNLRPGEEQTFVRIYNPETDSWTLGTDIPTKRYNFGAAVLDDTIYLIGGHTHNWIPGNFAPSPTNEKYIPIGYIPEFPSWTIISILISTSVIMILKNKLRKRE